MSESIRTFKQLKEQILKLMQSSKDSRFKRSVARRVAEKMALQILRMQISSWDPVHKGTLHLTYLFGELPFELTKSMVEQLCAVVIRGTVFPVQRVKELILEANRAFMGICVCRFSGRTKDLYVNREKKQVYSLVDEHESRQLMDTIIQTYHRLNAHGPDGETDASFGRILKEMEVLKHHSPHLYGIEGLWERTHPFWEILIEHREFTTVWKESQTKNKKTTQIHRELLNTIVDALYSSRGVVFSSMEMFDTKYTICSCPGPEVDHGCLLFNWYYYSNNPHAIKPNQIHSFGQYKDAMGVVQPCKKYNERMSRDCLGCGCPHETSNEEG